MPPSPVPRSRLIYSVFHLTDLSPESEHAFAHALAIALLRSARLTVLHAGENGSGAAEDWARFPHVRATLERWGLLEPGSRRADVFDKLAVQVKKVDLGRSSSVSSILDYLSDSPAELIVTAYDAVSGVTGVRRDATVEEVARGSGAMTLFIPSGCRGFVSVEDGSLSMKRILVPIADDPAPAFAAEAARRAAEMFGDPPVEIVLLHVGDAPPVVDVADDDLIRVSQRTEPGDVVDTIVDVAAELEADLISMVTNGRSSLGEALRGSHTERVVRQAPCPVLALPESWSRVV